MRAYLIPIVCLSLLGTAANATTYYGEDDGAGAGDARPNSAAAQASFLANAGAVGPVIDFEAVSLGYATPLDLGSGVTASFSGANPTFSGVTDEDTTNFGYNTTAGGSRFLRFTSEFGSSATLTFSFDQAVRSFGAYFTGVETNFGSISVTSSDGSVTDFGLPGSVSGGGVLFFGLTDVLITSITITNVANPSGGRDLIGLDDIYVGAAVPEPTTWALLILGFGGAGAMLRARRRTALA
ncbi:MAG: PEPxxWA-CTERM sorting domain-containing protein [Phenylobacterium sp.]|uniref:PEPxxWA-CTERM sorting domain-containing protein n=1 Tax=Phenylobacterium sp. TaxID=1871053 RepID=UPI001A36DF40|nr:PEPxxWA-CTERM sorting domain-containing protein [Phenylobacterium sp.]MBL8770707.1 PEPxxWA-CTERM sorting domain-containing protein [Phenylobacterium sp.]